MQQRTHHFTQLVRVPTAFCNPLAPIAPPPAPVLLPLIGEDDELSPALERVLRPIVIRAQAGDWTARDALYRAFEAKLRRICHRIPLVHTNGVWDIDDIQQEGWLAFAALVERWPADCDFGAYLLAYFPWRLRDAIRDQFRRAPLPSRRSAEHAVREFTAVPCKQAAHDVARADLDLILNELDPLDRCIVNLRMDHGLYQRDIGELLQIGERTVSRRLQRIRMQLAELLAQDTYPSAATECHPE